MKHCGTLMGQLLQLIPRHVFDHQVDSLAWQGLNPPKLTYWPHLGAMLSGQWSARKNLRDLVFSLNRQVRKFYHLGLAAVPRFTLAGANKPRPAVIFEKTYYKLYERLSAWSAWNCGRCLVSGHQITGNHCYSISVPDSSEHR